MKFVKPRAHHQFLVLSNAEWPQVVFQTDQAGPHRWSWSIKWRNFLRQGNFATTGNSWDATGVITNLGGTLSVRADCRNASSQITVEIRGQNPNSAEVKGYLASFAGSSGFEKIIAQESKFRHFNSTHEPIRSFDNGYGICQLTNPAPTLEQCWNWKLNISAGMALYNAKRTSAISYLSQGGRTYTASQLLYETVSRWNGGSYHEWDKELGQWVRHHNILCDSKTGNIGWDLSDPANSGKTEEQLHKRDSGGYSKHTKGAHWKYLGPCYADHVLGTPAGGIKILSPPPQQTPSASPFPVNPARLA